MIQLIDFKNTLSRSVEGYQMRLADDRFSSFNGLRRAQAKLIYFKDNKPQQVLGRLYGKRITLVTNDKTTAYLKDFSLYQARKSGVFFVSEALKKGLVTKDWNKNFEWPTTPDCCLVIPGESDKLIFCAASNDGRKLEKAGDICKVKLSPFKKLVKMQLRGVQLSEYGFEILSDQKKFNNCKSKEFKLFKERVDYALTVASVEDCKILMNYSQLSIEEKFRYCFKHYSDEMKMEINLLANDNAAMFNKLSDCFYSDDFFKVKLNSKHLRKLLGLPKKKSSFMQTNEVDEIDNDDDGVVEIKKKIAPINEVKKVDDNKLAFTQIKETQSDPTGGKKKKKVKEIEQIMYNKKKSKGNSEVMRNKLFRIKEMNSIQNNHNWRPSLKEGMGKDYSKLIAAQGNKNADTFVGFLGWMRDSSYDGNQNVMQMDIDRFFK